MRIEPVEIYSDATNAAVMRHPGRQFPGCLVQGDSLNALVRALDTVRVEADYLSAAAADELQDVAEELKSLLSHYKSVLTQHGIELPFNDQQS